MDPGAERLSGSPPGAASSGHASLEPEAVADGFIQEVPEDEGLDYSVVSPAYAAAVSAGAAGFACAVVQMRMANCYASPYD